MRSPLTITTIEWSPWDLALRPSTDTQSAKAVDQEVDQEVDQAVDQAVDQDVPQEADPTADQATPYDSIWTQTGIPVQESTGIERQLLKEDKLYAVLAVVLIIWLGIAFFLIRTDRKLDRLERRVDTSRTSPRIRPE